jgi:excisionase family DNA binding protein
MTHSASSTDGKQDHLAAATYTVAQLADLLGCSERHVHRQRDKKTIPGEFRIGRSVRFSRAVIDRWIASGTTTNSH